ncbi:MAG: PEP-CTERM sorting domain-containing protein [Verrucomicrobiae bacterium]|nr:PEP-CTERM sorting domain-containing protein [Verrucomicrobiae bacterium]
MAAAWMTWVAGTVNATIITNALWTFEAPNTPADATATVYPNLIPPAIGSGNAGGAHALSSSWTTPVGNGSPESFSVNNWSIGDYFQFQTTTLHNYDIKLEWDQARSSLGPAAFKLQYSTDGVTFTDYALYTVLTNAVPFLWTSSGPRYSVYTHTYDLSSITALNNQPTVYFRLTSISAAGGGAGTVRVDNFLVTSSMIPEPSTVVLIMVGSVLIWRRLRS